MVIGLAAALAASVLFGVGAVVQAVAARRHGLLSWLMLGVALVYLVGWALHLVSIALLPLYLAQVGIAGYLAITAITAARVLGEPVGRREWVAIAALGAGLVVLVASAGEVGHSRFHVNVTIALYAALVALLVAGVVAARSDSPHSGDALALVSGLAYAGSPVATRSLVDFRLDADVIAPALTIGLFGLLGFWLYSLSLQRTSVTAATAWVVAAQTLVPAAVGVLVFDDGIRSGWWLPAAAGFALATLGALALSGSEARLEVVTAAD